MQALANYINAMSDSRSGNAPRRNFYDLMTISLLCAISDGETAVDMENFGKSKEEFLRQFLDLPHGIPCHDAYSRLCRMIKPDSFQTFFDKFRADFAAAAKESPAIALDGKEMRRSFDKAAEQSNFSIVTAFAHGIKLSLGITKSGKASSEILSLRELAKMLDIREISITTDALHCQRETCKLIVQERDEYCLQLKANQKEFLKDTRAIIDDDSIEYIDEYNSFDKGHGRIEERSYHVYNVPDHLIQTHQWPHLDAFVHVVSKRTIKEETSRSDRIYLFSKALMPRQPPG